MSLNLFGAPPSNEAVALQDTYLDLLYMTVETEHLRWGSHPRESSLASVVLEGLAADGDAGQTTSRSNWSRSMLHPTAASIPSPDLGTTTPVPQGWREPQTVLSGLRQELLMPRSLVSEIERDSVSKSRRLPPRVAGCSSGSRTRWTRPDDSALQHQPSQPDRDSGGSEGVRQQVAAPTASRTISTRRCRRPSTTKRDADTMAGSFTLEPRSSISSRSDGMGVASTTQQRRRPLRRRHLPTRAESDRRGRKHRSPPAWTTRRTSTRCFRGDRPTRV